MNLKPQQYDFDVQHNAGEKIWYCDIQFKYPIDVELAGIGAILDIRKFRVVKSFNFRHEVPENY